MIYDMGSCIYYMMILMAIISNVVFSFFQLRLDLFSNCGCILQGKSLYEVPIRIEENGMHSTDNQCPRIAAMPNARKHYGEPKAQRLLDNRGPRLQV